MNMFHLVSFTVALIVGFNPDMYSVTEGGMAPLILQLSQVSSQPVTVQLDTQDQTANGIDFF